MFNKVAPYMGEYKKYTIRAVIMMCIGIVAKTMPYFFLYQMISPLTKGQSISLGYLMLRVLGVLLSEMIYSFACERTDIFPYQCIQYPEKLKSISTGETGKTVTRKYREPWNRSHKKGIYRRY